MEDFHGPYFSKEKDAAAYCSMSVEEFRKARKEFVIPRRAGPYSPKKYAASDLDAFMQNPEEFRIENRQRQGKAKPLAFNDRTGEVY